MSAVAGAPLFAQFTPNNLVVSRSVYTGTSSLISIGEIIPPAALRPSTAVCTGAGVGGPADQTGVPGETLQFLGIITNTDTTA